MKRNALLVLIAGTMAAQTPLPEGEGKKIVEKVCLDCHGPENFTSKKRDKEGWEKVIADMVEKGAQGTDEEYDKIVAYLVKNFGKDQKR